MIWRIIDLLLGVVAAPLLACCTYLFGLAILARRQQPPAYGKPTKRFDIVVPAHNEETTIASTVKSLLAVDYPADLRRVIVVADNCSDATKDRAKDAGATVLVRENKDKRGKGYALLHGFEYGLKAGTADVFVVVDADTVVSKNLLSAFAARFDKGARAAQAEYAVRNPEASWRTRLMVLALALFHELRSLSRERLGLSAGLRGNGMAFARDVLIEAPYDAFSLVEDLEYGIRLGRAGIRVHYAHEAAVFGEMVSSEQASRSQRRRWDGGRIAMARAHGANLVKEAITKRDRVLGDLAIDVLVPPLSYLVVFSSLGTFVTTTWAIFQKSIPVSTVLFAVSLFFLFVYIARGIQLARLGVRGILELAWAAPTYVFWKLRLALSRDEHKKGEWVRTTREGEKR